MRTRADRERGPYSLYDRRSRHGLQALSDRRSSQETWFLRKKRVAAHRATEAGWRCLTGVGACALLGICRTDMNSTSGKLNDRCPNFVIIGVEVCVVSYATFDIPVFIKPQRTRISCGDACGPHSRRTTWDVGGDECGLTMLKYAPVIKCRCAELYHRPTCGVGAV